MNHRPLVNGRSGLRVWPLGLAVLALSSARPVRAADPVAPDRAFLGDHCTSCHNAEEKKGRLDLASLAMDPKDAANLALWIRVHDRVAAGEMPPKGRPRPAAVGQ
jgi:mono/diheme cytochrome c family protein